jgi:hypothetical protein
VDELKRILGFDDYKDRVNPPELTIYKIREGIELDFSKMYDAPTLSLSMLKALGEFFGTEKIDVDNYSEGGCETCDHGSAYGHKIQVLWPTKNVPEKFPVEVESQERKSL